MLYSRELKEESKWHYRLHLVLNSQSIFSLSTKSSVGKLGNSSSGKRNLLHIGDKEHHGSNVAH